MCEDQTEVNNHTREELRMLYQVATSNLIYYKDQQWKIVNYALSLDAAMIGITILLDEKMPIRIRVGFNILLTVSLLIIAFTAIYILRMFEGSIISERKRYKAAEEFFSLEYKKASQGTDKEYHDDDIYQWLWYFTFAGALLAWIFAFILLWIHK